MFAKKGSKIVYDKLGKEMLEVHVYALVVAIVVSFLEEYCHALHKCVTNAKSIQLFFHRPLLLIIDCSFWWWNGVFLDMPTLNNFKIKESQQF